MSFECESIMAFAAELFCWLWLMLLSELHTLEVELWLEAQTSCDPSTCTCVTIHFLNRFDAQKLQCNWSVKNSLEMNANSYIIMMVQWNSRHVHVNPYHCISDLKNEPINKNVHVVFIWIFCTTMFFMECKEKPKQWNNTMQHGKCSTCKSMWKTVYLLNTCSCVLHIRSEMRNKLPNGERKSRVLSSAT